MQMILYQCNECTKQYVLEQDAIICPHCESTDASNNGLFSIEDINELLEERQIKQDERQEPFDKIFFYLRDALTFLPPSPEEKHPLDRYTLNIPKARESVLKAYSVAFDNR